MKYLTLLLFASMLFGSNADLEATDYIPTTPADIQSPIEESRQWTQFPGAGDRLTHGTVYDFDDDLLFMVGGTPNGQSGSNLPLIAVYDPTTQTWNTGLAPMPDARGWIQGGYWNGKIYVMCGYTNSGSGSNTCYIFDIAGNSWSAGANCPRATLAHGNASYNGSIYVIGGLNSSLTQGTTNVTRYDIANDSWTNAALLVEQFDMGGVTFVDNRIYIIGGYNRGSGSTYSIVKIGTINPSDPDDITWNQLDPLPIPNAINSATALDDNGWCFMLGGFENLSSVTNAFWMYDPSAGTWTQGSNYPVPIARNHFLIGRDGYGEIYAMAGDANGDWSPPNDYYYYHENLGVMVQKDIKAIDLSLSVMPTVVRKAVNISFSLSSPSTVLLNLYNAAGQRISSLYKGSVESYNTHVLVNDLPAGVYFIKLSTDSETTSQKLVVAK